MFYSYMIKNFIDFRIKGINDPSEVNDYQYTLEVQHEFLGIKYWLTRAVSNDLDELTRDIRFLKRKYGKKN